LVPQLLFYLNPGSLPRSVSNLSPDTLTHSHMHAHTHSLTHTCTHTHTHTHSLTHAHTHTHTHMHTHKTHPPPFMYMQTMLISPEQELAWANICSFFLSLSLSPSLSLSDRKSV